MQEIWKDVEEYPNYKISNLGRVYSIKNDIMLKQRLDKDGYPCVTLSHKGKTKYFFVHRLVAKSFLKNPNNLPTINHIDENKTNNCVNNLEYMTHKDNVRYSQAKKVYQYDKSFNLVKIWDSVMDIERTINIPNQSISACCRKECKSIRGYVWSYVPLT